jgi:hypothetical protein
VPGVNWAAEAGCVRCERCVGGCSYRRRQCMAEPPGQTQGPSYSRLCPCFGDGVT